MSRVEITDELKQRTIARRWAEFDIQACAHFRKLHGETAGWFGQGVLDNAARQGVKDARRWGNDTVGGMLDYLTMVYMMGHQFTSDPQYQSWVGPWIKHTNDTGERLKTEHLIREALDLLPNFYPTESQWVKALNAAEALLQTAAAPTKRMTEDDARQATVRLLSAVWPERLKNLGEEELSAEMHALNPVIGGLGCKTPELFAAGAMLALHFGVGFLSDPRLPRFQEIARSEELSGRERLLSILRTAWELAIYKQNGSFE